MKRLTALILITLSVNTVFPAGESEESQTAKGPITVASKIDTEGALLGNMIMKVLDENGFAVDNRTEFGPTDVVRKAIIAGEIDIYPEYTGNGGFFFSDTPSDVWKDREAGYELVKETRPGTEQSGMGCSPRPPTIPGPSLSAGISQNRTILKAWKIWRTISIPEGNSR